MKQSKKIQVEMVADRGYEIPDEEQHILYEDDPEIDDYNTIYQGPNVLGVYFMVDKSLKEFREMMEDCDEGILIYSEVYDKIVKKQKFKQPIQFFFIEELQSNITKNVFNGTYTIVTNPFNVHDLPVLYLNDPIVKYYNYPAGTVLKVVEENDLDTLNPYNIIFCIVKNATF